MYKTNILMLEIQYIIKYIVYTVHVIHQSVINGSYFKQMIKDCLKRGFDKLYKKYILADDSDYECNCDFDCDC